MDLQEPQPDTGVPPYVDHLGPSREYWRDIILGVNDGLVSMFLLVAGVVGGALDTRTVLLTGVAGAIAGSISMGVGEYIATKAQEEVFQGEVALEREHIKYHRKFELDELKEMFVDTGLNGSLAEEVVAAYDEDDEALMKIMMALEFGFVDEHRRNPYVAMAVSGVLFLSGALTSVVPFMFDVTPRTGLMWAAGVSGIALFGVGAAKTMATRGHWLRAGLENLALAAIGAGVSYFVGVWYQANF
jgi:VIT1/CCC1 family predicted Fe2+/Mn2+ transporter